MPLDASGRLTAPRRSARTEDARAETMPVANCAKNGARGSLHNQAKGNTQRGNSSIKVAWPFCYNRTLPDKAHGAGPNTISNMSF